MSCDDCTRNENESYKHYVLKKELCEELGKHYHKCECNVSVGELRRIPDVVCYDSKGNVVAIAEAETCELLNSEESKEQVSELGIYAVLQAVEFYLVVPMDCCHDASKLKGELGFSRMIIKCY